MSLFKKIKKGVRLRENKKEIGQSETEAQEKEIKIEEERKNYLIKECYWGSFSREIILPVEIDGSRAKASIKEGILKIRIPKLEREKKRKISIKEE